MCKVTNCNPNPIEIGSGNWPNKPNIINFKRVGERIGLIMDFLTVNQGSKLVRGGVRI